MGTLTVDIMKVAAVQFAPKLKSPQTNIKAMEALVAKAVENEAALVVFPELSTTGYSFMSPQEAMPYAEFIGGFPHAISEVSRPLSLLSMQALVNQYRIAIAWGVMTVDGQNRLYNSQVLLTPTTMVAYNKANQWGNDYLWATEGSQSPPIIRYRNKSLGLLICRDVRDKGPKGSSLKDFYMAGDTDIVCFSANFGRGGFPAVSWIEFAKDNGTWLIVSNRYGLEEHNDFGPGGICVVEPSGKVHCEGLKWNQPCIVYTDIP